MRRALTGLALLLGLPLSIAACLWDRDTPADEAKGLPEVVAVLSGRFARNPPLFYEMRLARITVQLQSHPEDLAAYDDVGVASDRLGRGDEAISWMDKKRAQLDKLDGSRPEVREHQYRYHANLGTFLVHRWARQGRDRTRIDEVKAARDEIAKAIEVNPHAHFGRERYQLRALDWIMDPPKAAGLDGLPNLLGWSFGDTPGQPVAPSEADDAVGGLSGLIVLGNAWESVDIFHALSVALNRDSLGTVDGGRKRLAYLAWLRCRELIDAGKGSMLPDAPTGHALLSALPRRDVGDSDALRKLFVKLRAEADAWQAARTAFMTRRLKAGRHPDTDPDFWIGYTEHRAPDLPSRDFPWTYYAWEWIREKLPLLAVAAIAGLLVVRWVNALRRKARLDDFAA